ncbi:MAG TPA: tetratricopeptide repeat protein [Candidatus Melainabacteria bacterium]|nr:tetratricopeptide repeat protein [Candidatus Melainabacteria bacterium]
MFKIGLRAISIAVFLGATGLVSACSSLPSDQDLSAARYSSEEWKKQFEWLTDQEDTDFLLFVRQLDVAESMAQSAIKRGRKFSKDDSRLARSETSLGRVLLEKGEYEKGIAPLQDALRIKTAAYGKNSADVADILTELAYAEINLGQVEKARKSIDEAIAIRKKIKDVFASIDSDFVEGLILEGEGKMKEAKSKYASSIVAYNSRLRLGAGELSNAQLNRTRICLRHLIELRKKHDPGADLKPLNDSLAYLNEWFFCLGRES